MKLVIVESPAKSKTINKYLGKDYTVLASFGHIRDLPSKDGSVLPDEDFAMTWAMDKKAEKRVKDIIAALKDSDTLILATDPDREGEAISWHLLEELKRRKKLKKDLKIERVVFHEITKKAVKEAIDNPREINQDLVAAYLARRSLDYLVGFNLSPVLWRKLPGSKSAGRVQSVALRLICEREMEIEKFKKQEYWSIEADLLNKEKAIIKSRLTHLDGKKLEKFDIDNEEKALIAKSKIEAQDFKISNVERKKSKRNPSAPFTTSTLQQEASRKLRFSTNKTMQVAQKLYEGIDIGGETVGLITYMRTDAVSLAKEAIDGCREAIEKYFGEQYLPKKPRDYKNKTKNAQEAHEAIRPTGLLRTPKQLQGVLDTDQYKLYELIWKRTVASQMESAVFDKVVVDSTSLDEQITLRANGQVIAFDGFLKLYQESKDDNKENDENKLLPNVEKGEDVSKGEIRTEQHFTQPPARFTEASLVKKLEELGIGRPSTYASIITVLQTRKYVKIEKQRFIPEDRGRIVVIFLESYFNRYVEYDFTAKLEDQLDIIANGQLEWKKLLKGFWNKFVANIDEVKPLKISEVLDKIDEMLSHHFFPITEEGVDPKKCPDCENGTLSIKLGKFGAFIGCSNYPECKHTTQLTGVENGEDENGDKKPNQDNKVLGTDKNGLNIYLKKGPYGFYVQLGEDATATTEKPKRCSLPKGFEAETITFDQALSLLELPKVLGIHPEYKEEVSAAIGKFGPYVKIGSTFKSLEPTDDITTITLERAVELLSSVPRKAEPVKIGEHPKDKKEITLNVGRYGPYLKYGKSNIALPKALKDKKEITLEEALKVIEEKAKK
jgi:DNA topoisomerase-1